MRTIELFSGTASFSKVARERGHETFTVDIDARFKPDLVKDVMDLKVSDLPYKPDILWLSPPCTCFSVASLRFYWNNKKPANEKTLKAIALVKRTVELIDEINPVFWFLENPRGMLRKQNFMRFCVRRTITYCRYGFIYQKPTDIFTNCWTWTPKPACTPGAPCHLRTPRGSHYGIQDYKRSPIDRAIVPPLLIREILDACEKEVI